MRFSINVPNFGDFADPETFVEVAKSVKEAGRDALFVWDHVVENKQSQHEISDPWVLLTTEPFSSSVGWCPGGRASGMGRCVAWCGSWVRGTPCR